MSFFVFFVLVSDISSSVYILTALAASLKPETIKMGKRVIGLSGKGHGPVHVKYTERVAHSPKSEKFDSVLVTAPFGSVRLLGIFCVSFFPQLQKLASQSSCEKEQGGVGE